MKRLFLSTVFCLVCATTVIAQDCKLCGVWSGAYKDEYPSGDQYRVKIEFTIESPKRFEYYYGPWSAAPHYVDSDDVFLVDDECNDYRIKYYTEVRDDDWGSEKFNGRIIGISTIRSYFVLEHGEEENTILFRKLGSDISYYDEYGNYIGKEWRECEAISCLCVLHQLED